MPVPKSLKTYWRHHLVVLLKFGNTYKGYKYKTESILENEMHKILWDFELDLV